MTRIPPAAPLIPATRPRGSATVLAAVLLSFAFGAIAGASDTASWLQEWNDPGRSFQPRVIWGWPGNAITPGGIDKDLQTLSANGIGGVGIVTYWQVFQQGNVAPLSDRWFEQVRHTLDTASRLNMEVGLAFTEAGWSFGGSWIPPADRSKVLVRSWVDVEGPANFREPLPRYQVPPVDPVTPKVEPWRPNPAPDEQAVVAIVAGRLTDRGIDGESLAVLPVPREGETFSWDVPTGKWRLMVFQLKYTGQINQAQNFEPPPWVVDHLNPAAMRRYIDTLGGRLEAGLGDRFGTSLHSLYCDSFEVKTLPDSVLWSNGVLDDFRSWAGYDFTRWLPAIWWNVGPDTPRLRHDLNNFLGRRSIDGMLRPFVEWCTSRGMKARVEPIDTFPGEIIESTGLCTQPETEKSVARFAVSTYPRKCEAAGLRFYGRSSILSAEAFTTIFRQRYRVSLEDMKIVADGFLRDGVTQFYDHGFWHTPEEQIVPSRDFPFATRVSPGNTWWPWFADLNRYLSRCAFLLRQGDFAGDLLVYSPQDDLWSDRGVWGGDWRTLPFARLGTTLVANGYDFDPVNNDVLQNRARIEGGRLTIGRQSYRATILPNIAFMPPETLAVLDAHVRAGGTLVALNRLPEFAPGMRDHERRDREVRERVLALFGANGKGRVFPGGGATYLVSGYPMDEEQEQPDDNDDDRFKPQPPLDGGRMELVRTLRSHVDPDVALPGDRQSDGLTFLHRRAGEADIYFLTNLEAGDFDGWIRFRVHGKTAEIWDPESGAITAAAMGGETDTATKVWVTLDSLQSAFVVFKPGTPPGRVLESNLAEIRLGASGEIVGEAAHPGVYTLSTEIGGRRQEWQTEVAGLPSPKNLDSGWMLDFGSRHGAPGRWDPLVSWTVNRATLGFSGTAEYERTLEWEPDGDDLEWILDLGAVGDIAEVFVNDARAGVCWKRPYRFNVTRWLRPGRNDIRVRVTNRLLNRIASMTENPPIAPDVARLHGAAHPLLARVPDGFNHITYARDPSLWATYLAQKERGFRPLPDSGLLGPVRLRAVRVLRFSPQSRMQAEGSVNKY